MKNIERGEEFLAQQEKFRMIHVGAHVSLACE